MAATLKQVIAQSFNPQQVLKELGLTGGEKRGDIEKQVKLKIRESLMQQAQERLGGTETPSEEQVGAFILLNAQPTALGRTLALGGYQGPASGPGLHSGDDTDKANQEAFDNAVNAISNELLPGLIAAAKQTV